MSTLTLRPVSQSHYDEEGNCESACIASLIGCELAEVPNYNGDDWQAQVNLVRPWLRDRGWDYVHYGVILDENDQPPEFADWEIPVGYWIAAIVTPHSDKWHHAVVMRGREMVWNPDPRGGPKGDVMRLVRTVSILVPCTATEREGTG